MYYWKQLSKEWWVKKKELPSVPQSEQPLWPVYRCHYRQETRRNKPSRIQDVTGERNQSKADYIYTGWNTNYQGYF